MIILRKSLTTEIYIAALNNINKGTAEDIVLTNHITTSTITEDIPTTTTKIATTCLLCQYPNDHPLDHNSHGALTSVDMDGNFSNTTGQPIPGVPKQSGRPKS